MNLPSLHSSSAADGMNESASTPGGVMVLAVLRLVLLPIYSVNTLVPLLLVVVAAGYELSGLLVMDIIGSFYYAVVSSDRAFYTQSLLKALGIVSMIAVLLSLQSMLQQACALQWRLALVAHQHRRFFRYSAPSLNVDSDQRITQDTDRLTTCLSLVFSACIVKPCVAIFYTVFLATKYHWTVPAWCGVYFVLSIFCSALLSKPLVSTVATQEEREGRFRFVHALHRSAYLAQRQFYGREGMRAEKLRLDTLFLSAFGNLKILIRQGLFLGLSTNFFSYAGSIVAYAVIGNALLNSSSSSTSSSSDIASRVAEGSYACLALISAFSDLNTLAQNLAFLAGYCARVGSFLKTLEGDEAEADKEGRDFDPIDQQQLVSYRCCSRKTVGFCADAKGISSSSSPLLDALLAGVGDEEAQGQEQGQEQRRPWKKTAAALSIASLDVRTPDLGRLVLPSLSLEVPVGARVLVKGQSGCGKTSLLRAIAAGLDYSHDSDGHVQSLFDSEAIAFVPQSPHLFDGSLRANLCFPSGLVLGRRDDDIDEDAVLEAALTAVRLQHLVQGQGLQKEAEWHRILTPGEKQRLEFARLLVQKGPGLKLVVLDEPTSSLGAEDESRCFRALLDVAPGLTVVTATHGVSSLAPLHTHSLDLSSAVPSSSSSFFPLVSLR